MAATLTMLYRVLPRTLDLWGVRSPALLTLGTPPLPRAMGHAKPLPGHRCLSCGRTMGKGESKGYAGDPQVKEWMKELQKDFTRHPQEKDAGGRIEEGKEGKEEKDVAGVRAEEGKEGQEEKDVEEKREDEGKERGNPQNVWSQLVSQKYHKLDTHTQIIYDYDEEKQRREAGLWDEEEEAKREKVKLQRGETGVFDVEELVDLLREDNAQDMVVIQIPPELMYVDYMVLVSSSSQRHRGALAMLVRGAYKLKKGKKDPSVVMEGKGTDWVAMDMGNIVLHIMKPETREMYDLESLWTVGAAFDEKSQVTEEELVGVRRPRDPMPTPPSPSPPTLNAPPEAVT